MNTSRVPSDDPFMLILAKDTVKVGVPCSLGKALPLLEPAMRSGVEAAMANPAIAAAKIARGLGTPELGHKVSPDAVVKHRRQECGCFR